jgi:putative membrane protein
MKKEINKKTKNTTKTKKVVENKNTKVEVKEKKWNKRQSISKTLDIFIHLLGYTLVLITVSFIFKDIVSISNIYYGFLAVLIIFILNRTVKPVLTWLTIPLTAMTLGLFYPLINAFILKLSDWILGSHFNVHGIVWLVIVSLVITIMNAIMDNFIIDEILKGGKKK